MESSSIHPSAVRTAVIAVLVVLSTVVGGGPASAGALEEGSCGAKLAAGHAPPVGVGSCPGVRPGGYVDAPEGGCTLNFLFSVTEPTPDGPRTVRYIATAGHCVLSEQGEAAWGYNQGPRAYSAGGAKIGEFVYAILDYGDAFIGPFRDFALIRLDGNVTSRAQVCHFGGPTGITSAIRDEPVAIHHYGQGLGIGEAAPARTAVARLNDPDVAGATGVINYGDSGSPVITEGGRAIGVIVQFFEETGPGTFGITRLRPQILRAEKLLGVDMRLLTASVL